MSTHYLAITALSIIQIHCILSQDAHCDTRDNDNIKYLMESEILKDIIRKWWWL